MFRAITLFLQLISLMLIGSSNASANDEIWLFEDPTGTKTYDEVIANPQWFEKSSDTSRGFSDSTYWIKLSVINYSSAPITQMVQFDSLRLPLVEEYLVTESGMRLRSNGFSVPLATRPSALLKTSFPIELDGYASAELLYRIESNFKIDLGYQVNDLSQSVYLDHKESAVGLLLLGGLVVLMLYNLILAVAHSGLLYFAYSAFLFCSAALTVSYFRLYELLGISANSVELEAYAGLALYAFAYLFLSLLFKDNQTKTTKRLLMLGYAILAGHLILEPAALIKSYADWAGPIVFFVFTYLVINALLQKNPLAKYVLLGWGVYASCSLVYVANLNGWVGAEFEHIISYANLFEGVVLSGVLACRLRGMDRTEALLKEAQIELQRERLASEIGYGYKWEFDLERQMIRPDETFARWYGQGWQAGEWYPAEDLFAAVPEDWHGWLADDMQKCIESAMADPEYVFQTRHPLIRNDIGATIWIQVYGKLVEVDGRKLLIGTSLDVTQLIESNQAVEAEIEKFESLCEQATLLFWRLDLATKAVTYNRTFAKRWSLEPGGTIEFNEFANFMTPTFVKIMEESVDQVVSSGELVERVVQALAGPIRGQWYRLQFWPQFNEEGEVIGVDFANANINTLMQTQAELQSTLTKQKELFAIVGHELRTPVSSIKMLTEDEQITDRERTQQIAEISESLLNVLEDMRVVISPERALESKSVAENPAKLVRRALNSLKAIVAERGLSLSTEAVERSSATYLLHAQSLRQIVTNLVKNAAIHSGGSRIDVGFEISYVVGSAKARLRVEDDGKGIPAEKVEQLFEAFSRGETTQDGSGLGLYIVKQLAERLGGQIRYSQSPLGGACFTLNFALGEEVEAVKEIAPEPIPISLEGMRVLFAEDDNTLRMLTERMFLKKGAIVTACVNGREALDAFDPEQFDLVVTDLMMPEMDGHELTRSIRAIGATTPILAVTAAVIGKETEQFMQEGADAVLSKPLKAEALVETLMQMEITTQSMC
ncbi:ATP-binding protein [Marinobacterium sp. xm-d-564]|uniref:ATP-binding protein n=1 Tax=Marinobacterium sp. xm-d-564 TaxID=2497742 RepID=UPI00156A6E5E|nr:ATP-binding protein [Marinobacterium sp. xm-d-564]NRP60156.1 Sensor protein EvgS precursor [Marinobacterium sp. xm-d-564]